MARTAKAATEKPEDEPVVEAKEKPEEYEVKDYLKSHGSIMLGTHFIPIKDGKVKKMAGVSHGGTEGSSGPRYRLAKGEASSGMDF